MWQVAMEGIANAIAFDNILSLTFGTVMGIVVGIIPGIGPMVGMVVLLPFTYSLPPDIALSMLLGIFCGGYFGGAVPAILLRTPGVPSAAITALDGYPLTQKGEAQKALSSALVGSFSGGIISVFLLMLLAPALAHVAASFSSPEYCMVGVFGLVVVIAINRKQLSRASMLTGLGLLLGTVGIDRGTLVPRFTFGSVQMQNGLSLAAMCLGFFAIGQCLILLERKVLQTETLSLTRRTLDFSKIKEAFRYRRTLVKSAVIGTIAGLIPGPGSITACFFSYTEAKRSSKNPDSFGKGNPEGCIASEAGNNAVPAGTLIPLLTLGIPGDVIAALLLGIFTINGIYPGPLLLQKEPVLIYTLYFSMIMINIVGFFLLALFLRPFATITKLPSSLLAVSVMVISLLGIYSINLSIFDIGVAIALSILGYIIFRLDWPILPWVLGIVLGPIIEDRLRQSLSMSGGDPLIFVTRPISLGFVIVCLIILVVPYLIDLKRSGRIFRFR
jgi:putative tricarboxylic transport membrane protein